MKSSPSSKRIIPRVLLVSLILSIVSSGPAYAYNVYYDCELPGNMSTANPELGMAAELLDQLDVNPGEFPSSHEATVYQAIGNICDEEAVGLGATVPCESMWNGEYDFLQICSLWEEDYWVENPTIDGEEWILFNMCACEDWDPTSENSDYCYSIGEGGLSNAPFESLVAGSRYVDLREQPSLISDDLIGDKLENILGYRPYDNVDGSANKFPAQHSLLYSYIAGDGPYAMYDTYHSQPEGIVERNMAIATATTAFLFDRLLQADPKNESPPAPVLVRNFYEIDQDLKKIWEVGVLFAAAWMAYDEVTSELDFTCSTCMSLAALAGDGEGEDNGLANAVSAMAACSALPACQEGVVSPIPKAPVAYAMSVLENDPVGEKIWAKPDLFAMGQGVHAIGDSFAHAIRNYNSTYNGGVPIGSARLSGGGNWNWSHSDCYDHNCMKPGTSSLPFRFDEDNEKNSGDIYYYDPSGNGSNFNHLGKSNEVFTPQAVADWLDILRKPEFHERQEAFKEFVKKHFTVEIPQELYAPDAYGGGFAIYNPPFSRCTSDSDCSSGTGCDLVSGICRETCLDSSDCEEGFVCTSGERWDGISLTDNKYCAKYWDPWDLVADEYYTGTATNLGDNGEHWYSEETFMREPFEANRWYMLALDKRVKETNGFANCAESFPPFSCYASENLESAIDICESKLDEGEYLAGIYFEGYNYTGNFNCLIRESKDTLTSLSDTSGFGVESVYVEPGYRVCLTANFENSAGNSQDQDLCYYGGLNGTGEGEILKAWRNSTEEIRWDIPDIDGDGVVDADDNCMLTYNSAHVCDLESDLPQPGCCYVGDIDGILPYSCQEDMDADGFGDVCDHDIDGDKVLEDAGGVWHRGNGTTDDVCTGGEFIDCDDNCTVVPQWIGYGGPYALPPSGIPGGETCEYFGKRFNGQNLEGENMGNPDTFNPDYWRTRYTRNNYQEDLDADGVGDVCDQDRDGDGYRNLPCGEYDVATSDIEKTGRFHETVFIEGSLVWETVPTGEIDCNDFLWTVHKDHDRDGYCDFYNYYDPEFSGNAGAPAITYDPELPQPCLDPDPNLCPIEDYLLQNGGDGQHVVMDYAVVSYPVGMGSSEYGGMFDKDELNTETGEGMGEQAYDKWEWCARNVEAVLNHGSQWTTFGHGTYELGGGGGVTENLSFLADPGEQHDPGVYEMDTSVEAIHVYEGCQLDNCIRRSLGEDDALTRFLCGDAADSIQTMNSGWVTDHWGTTWQPENGGALSDACDEGKVRFYPSPTQAEEEGLSHNLYDLYFENPNQWDADANGVGDRCEVMPDMVNFRQELPPDSDAQIAVYWEDLFQWYYPLKLCSDTEFADRYAALGYEWCDKETELPVVVDKASEGEYPEPMTIPGISTIPADTKPVYDYLCDCPDTILGMPTKCELKRHVHHATARLVFDSQGAAVEGPNPCCGPLSAYSRCREEVVGEEYLDDGCNEGYRRYKNDLLTGDQQKTTFGACACEVVGTSSCFDDGFACDQRKEVQYNQDTGIATYKHHKKKFGFTYDESPFDGKTLKINKRCQPLQGSWGWDPGGYGPGDSNCWYSDSSGGWDHSSGAGTDGCEAIDFNFESILPETPDDMESYCIGPVFVSIDGATDPINHYEMDWSYLNEPAYWVDSPVSGDAWQDQFPFEGKYTVQWAAWAAEVDPVSSEIEAWNRFRFTEPEEYNPEEEGGYVWYEGTCKIANDLMPFEEINPFVPVYDMVTADLVKDRTRLNRVEERYNLRQNDDGEWVFSEAIINLGNGEIRREKEVSVDGFSVSPGRAPIARYAQGAGIVEDENGVPVTFRYIFGGENSTTSASRDMWIENAWSDGVWRLAQLAGKPPKGLVDARVAYDVASKRIFVLGGLDKDDKWITHIWSYSMSDALWQNHGRRIIPGGLAGYQVAMDARNGQAWLYGGTRQGNPSNVVYSLDLSSLEIRAWEDGQVTPPWSEGRRAFFHPNRNTLMVFGGTDDRTFRGDLWEFDPKTSRWQAWLNDGDLVGLERADAMVLPGIDGSTVYLAGGEGDNGPFDVTRVWDITPGRPARLVDGEADVVVQVNGAGWSDYLHPGNHRNIFVEYMQSMEGEAQYVNLHLEIPEGRTLSFQIVDSTNQIVGSGSSRGGETIASFTAQAGEQYRVKFTELDDLGAVDYKVWATLAQRRLRLTLPTRSIGGVDMQDERLFVAAADALDVYESTESGMELTAKLSVDMARDVVVEKNLAFIAAGDDGLVIADVTEARSPTTVGSLSTLGYARRLVKTSNEVFVSMGQYGVGVYNVSDPTEPIWSDSIVTVDVAEDIAVGNGALFVSNLSGVVEVYDLGGEERFARLAEIVVDGWIVDTQVRGDSLLVMVQGGTVYEYDVNVPARPVLRNETNEDAMATTGRTGGVIQATVDDSLWLSDSVSIYEIRDRAVE